MPHSVQKTHTQKKNNNNIKTDLNLKLSLASNTKVCTTSFVTEIIKYLFFKTVRQYIKSVECKAKVLFVFNVDTHTSHQQNYVPIDVAVTSTSTFIGAQLQTRHLDVSADHRPSVGRLKGNRPTIGRSSADDRPIVNFLTD